MLEAMRQLALDSLWAELDDGNAPDPENWYRELRASDLGRLFPKLIEDVEQDGGKDKQRYYTLQPDRLKADTAVLKSHEFKDGDVAKLPFNQPSGSQAAALGPVIKRSAPSKAKEAGPTVKIQQTTLKKFEEIAGADAPWSRYFESARECFLRPKIEFNSEVKDAAGGALQTAVRLIDEKRTVLLVYQDDQDRLPGAVPEYVDYLQGVLSQNKYATGQVPALDGKTSRCVEQHRLRCIPMPCAGPASISQTLTVTEPFQALIPCPRGRVSACASGAPTCCMSTGIMLRRTT